jgi:hypothetical protein
MEPMRNSPADATIIIAIVTIAAAAIPRVMGTGTIAAGITVSGSIAVAITEAGRTLPQ